MELKVPSNISISSSKLSRRVNISQLRSSGSANTSSLNFNLNPLYASNQSYQKSNELRQFANDNKDLLALISLSDSATQNLGKTEIQSRTDLLNIVIEETRGQLNLEAKSVLTRDYLTKNQDILKFVYLDIGGIVDLLNSEAQDANVPRAIDFFSKDSADSADSVQIIDYYFQEFANQVSAEFSGVAGLGDSEQFSENTEAGYYLLKNPFYSKVLNNPEQSSEVSYFLSVMNDSDRRDQFLSTLVNDLSQSSGNGLIDTTLLNANPNLSRLLAVSSNANSRFIPESLQYLKDNIQELLNSNQFLDEPLGHFDFSSFLEDLAVKQSKNTIGETVNLSTEYLAKNIELVQIIQYYSEFAEGLKTEENRKKIDRMQASPELDQGIINRLSRSFRSQFSSSSTSSIRLIF